MFGVKHCGINEMTLIVTITLPAKLREKHIKSALTTVTFVPFGVIRFFGKKKTSTAPKLVDIPATVERTSGVHQDAEDIVAGSAPGIPAFVVVSMLYFCRLRRWLG
jgi:hypothetical protein